MSIDEIWSYQVQEAADTQEMPADSNNVKNAEAKAEEETVTFGEDAGQDASGEPAHAGFQDVEKVMAADELEEPGGNAPIPEHSGDSPTGEYEFVDDAADVGGGEPEMDELEAEIARELEGM